MPATDTFRTEVNWLATAAGRIGYAWDRWLLFGRGGWTGGNVKLALTSTVGPVASSTNWANGWTIGGGVEYMLLRCVSLGIAYDHIELNLDGETVTCPTCGTGVGFGTPSIDAAYRAQSVMARLNYFFMPKD